MKKPNKLVQELLKFSSTKPHAFERLEERKAMIKAVWEADKTLEQLSKENLLSLIKMNCYYKAIPQSKFFMYTKSEFDV